MIKNNDYMRHMVGIPTLWHTLLDWFALRSLPLYSLAVLAWLCMSTMLAMAHEGQPCFPETFYEGTDSAYTDTVCLHYHYGEIEERDPISAILGGGSDNGANFRGVGLLSVGSGNCLPPIDNDCHGCNFENSNHINNQYWKFSVEKIIGLSGEISSISCSTNCVFPISVPDISANLYNQEQQNVYSCSDAESSFSFFDVSHSGYHYGGINIPEHGVKNHMFLVPYTDFYTHMSSSFPQNMKVNEQLAPLFGDSVLRLGHRPIVGTVRHDYFNTLIKGIEVGEDYPASNYLTFDFALRLNHPDHDGIEPSFRILIYRKRDGIIQRILKNKNKIDIGIGVDSIQSSHPLLNSLQGNSDVRYLNWSCGKIDLSIGEDIEVGDTLYIAFEVNGCAHNGHEGILYLDNLEFNSDGFGTSGICRLEDTSSFVRYDAVISGHSLCVENAGQNICFDYQLPVAEYNNQSITGSITLYKLKLKPVNEDEFVIFIENSSQNGSILSIDNITLKSTTPNPYCFEIPDNLYNHAYVKDDDAQSSDEILVHNNITYRKVNLNEGYSLHYYVSDAIGNGNSISYPQSDAIGASFIGTSLSKDILTISNTLSYENIACQEGTPNLIVLEAKNIQNMISNNIENNNTLILQEKINKGEWSNLSEFDWSPIMNGSKYQTMLANKNFIPLSCLAECHDEFFYHTQYAYRILLCSNDSLVFSNVVNFHVYPALREENYYNQETSSTCQQNNIPHTTKNPCMGVNNGSIAIDVACIIGGEDDYTFTLYKSDKESGDFDENDCYDILANGIQRFREDGMVSFEDLGPGVYRLFVKTPCGTSNSKGFMETFLDFNLTMDMENIVQLDPIHFWCDPSPYPLTITIVNDNPTGYTYVFDREDPLNIYTNRDNINNNTLLLHPYQCNGGVHKITITNPDASCIVTKEVFVVDFNPPAIDLPQYEEVLAINAIKYKSSWLHEFSDLHFEDPNDLIQMQYRNPYATGQVGIYKPYQQYDYLDDRRAFQDMSGTSNTIVFDNRPEAYLQTDGVIGTVDIDKTVAKGFVWNHPALDDDCLPEWQFNNQFTLYNTNGNNIENKDLLDRYTSAIYTHEGMLATAVASNAQQNEIASENFELFNPAPNNTNTQYIYIQSGKAYLGYESKCIGIYYPSEICFPMPSTQNLKSTLFEHRFNQSTIIDIDLILNPGEIRLDIVPHPIFNKNENQIQPFIIDNFKFKFELFYDNDETPIYQTPLDFQGSTINNISIPQPLKVFKNKLLKGVVSVDQSSFMLWNNLSLINSGNTLFTVRENLVNLQISYQQGSNEYHLLNNPPSNFDFVNTNITANKAYLTPYKILKGFGNYAIIDKPYNEFCNSLGLNSQLSEITIDFAANGLEFHCRNNPNVPLEVVGNNQQVTIQQAPCTTMVDQNNQPYTMLVFKDRSMPGFPQETDALGYTFNSTMYWDGSVYEKRILTVGETAKRENIVSFSDEKAHSGNISLKVPNTGNDTIIFEHPDIKLIGGKTYLLSAWIHADYFNDLPPNQLTQENISQQVGIYLAIGAMPPVLFVPTGNVIEGWQKLEVPFAVPDKSGILTTLFMPNTDMYLDDIRIHPVDASMESYVYDPQTLRLEAVLDQNNYATFYKYDDEGSLFNVSKETVKGIKTLQISSNFIKKQ